MKYEVNTTVFVQLFNSIHCKQLYKKISTIMPQKKRKNTLYTKYLLIQNIFFSCVTDDSFYIIIYNKLN